MNKSFLFIHSSIDEYLAYFPSLTVINNAVMSILVNVSFCTFVSVFLDDVPGSSYISLYFQQHGTRVSQCSQKHLVLTDFKNFPYEKITALYIFTNVSIMKDKDQGTVPD